MKKVNAEGPKVLGPELPGRRRFTAKEVHERICEHCLVLDVRPKEAFAAAHIPGSINIPLGHNLPTWAGWVLPYDRPILIVPDDPADVADVVRHLLRVGFDDVQGYLEGGLADWESHGFELGRLATASVHDLAAKLEAEKGRPFVLDVRTDSEWDAGRIEGAHHIHGGLQEERYAEIPRDRPVAVVCGTGYRASIASSFLKREGYEDVTNVLGGMSAWKAAGLPTVKDRSPEREKTCSGEPCSTGGPSRPSPGT
ncbi:rhodanese-like domain-containing protein [Paludisphaera soli]|uniref:rhodanese-like domain-containing protein n=1 Tax=Paludisphaera soli TaxID=2712865 RepID=UPI0013EAB059|nr:rhodanese-like domain-containing protein [Paludisphaera soli]